MKKLKITKSDAVDFVKSNIAGNAMFATTYASYFLFESVMGLSVPVSLLYATIVGNTLGNLLNFIIQKCWVFNRRKLSQTPLQLGRYILFILMNAAINYVLILWMEVQFGITPYIGQFIAGLFFFGWNFLWYKLWVFKKEQPYGAAKAK